MVLEPLRKPGGPRGARDMLQSGLGFIALWFTHPYSALVVLAVVTP